MRIVGLRKLLLVTSAVLAAGGIAPGLAAASNTYTVNTAMDTTAANPTSSCKDANGKFSLRSVLECIDNGGAGSGAVTVDVPPGTYTLTFAGGSDQGTSGALLVHTHQSVTIHGAGAPSTVVDANFLDRAFQIDAGKVTIAGMTVENGAPGDTGNAKTCPGSPGTSEDGGGILDDGGLTLTGDTIKGNLTTGSGGGVEQTGTALLTIVNSTVTGNKACGGASSTPGNGGGIDESGGGTVVIRGSTISNNEAVGDGGGADEAGGASGSTPGGSMTITSSTVANNTAGDGGGVSGEGPPFDATPGNLVLFADLVSQNTANQGGGVWGSDVTTITNTTVTDNSADTTGGVYAVWRAFTISFSTINANKSTSGQGAGNLDACGDCGGGFQLDDSIVAYGVGSPKNCGEGIISNGDNVFSDKEGSCDAVASDHLGTNPELGPLTNNGGPTLTEALIHLSPAVDGGSLSRCKTETKDSSGHLVDQRAFVPRPEGAGCDIGAFEATPNLGVTASVDKNTILVGQQDTVTDVVDNSGLPAAVDSTFTDPTGGARIDSVTSNQGKCRHTTTTVSCNLGTVPAGAKVTITIVLTGLTPGLIPLESRTATTDDDLDQANNQDSVAIDVKPVPPPPPPPPPKRKPSIALAKLGPACYTTNFGIKVSATARAVAGIHTVTIKLDGHTILSYHGHPVLPTEKTLSVTVHASKLHAGRTYHVTATVVDLLGRTAHAHGSFMMCKPPPKRGFTG